MENILLFSLYCILYVFLFAIFERILNAVFFLFACAVLQRRSQGIYPAMQFQSHFIMFWLQIVGGALNFSSRTAVAIATTILWTVTVMAIVAVVFLFYEEAPENLRSFLLEYNSWIGPLLYHLIIWPLRILVTITENFIPLWNFGVTFVKNVVSTLLVTTLSNTGSAILDLGLNFGELTSFFTVSSFNFIEELDHKINRCEQLGNSCFEVTEWDLKTPLTSVPMIVGNALTIVTSMCPVLLFPFDIVFYPLTDPNIPTALHKLVNFFIHLFLELPRITAKRCKIYGSTDLDGIVMCVPDLYRAFEDFMATIRTFEGVMDNWLDMTLLVIESALKQESPVCTDSDKRYNIVAFTQDFFENKLLSIVALSPSFFAVTDGSSAQFIDAARSGIPVNVANAWPIVIDASLGVAAIGSLSGTTKPALFGCRCDDVDETMQITCAVADYFGGQEVNARPRIIDVEFQVPSTAYVMTCATTKISVQSIRWPSVRYTAVNEEPEIVAKRRVDAAVWVMPLCLDAGFDCSENSILTSCYPYCLALHENGSPSNQLILYDAEQWEEYVHLMSRDCIVLPTEDSENFAVDPRKHFVGSAVSVAVQTFVAATSSYNFLETDSARLQCTSSTIANSVVPKTLHYAERYQQELNSVRTEEQPFVVAGDVALVGNYNFTSLDFSVTAFRITGNSRNEFTMQRMLGGIPANPPLEVLQNLANVPEVKSLNIRDDEREAVVYSEATGQTKAVRYDANLITLPYRFSSSAFGNNAAVQLRDQIFYAQNPTLHIWKAFFSYCNENTTIGTTQLMIMSKYHPLAIFAIKITPDDITQVGTPILFTEDVIPSPPTADNCNQLFAVAVTGLEAIDGMNIAATVLYTTVSAGLNPFASNQTQTKIFYINTKTHEKREFEPWDIPLPKQPSEQNVLLCPGLQRMPQVGTILGEALISLVGPFVALLDIALALIGMIPRWIKTTSCPLESRGHTTLQRCGWELFSSFDDWLDAVDNANEAAWRSLIYIIDLLPVGKSPDFSFQGVFTGIYYGGKIQSPYIFANAKLVKKLDLGFIKMVNGVTKVQQVPIVGDLTKSVLAWSVFYGRIITRTLSELIPALVNGKGLPALQTLWYNVYNTRGTFSNVVISNSILLCDSLALLAGTSNPFARMLGHSCAATVYFYDGALDFALTTTVDAGFTGCVCYASSGHSVQQYVREKCLPTAPLHLQPLMLGISNGFVSVDEACNHLRSQLKDRLEHAMDPSFRALQDASDQLGLVFDWLRVWIGQEDGGKCLNFDTDPYVAALIPEPVDYFRVCGQTEYCELRCLAEIQNFDRAAEFDGLVWGDEEFSKSVESLFFTEATASSESNFIVIFAVLESFERPLTASVETDKCEKFVNVLGSEKDNTLAVNSYCIPRAHGLGIFHVGRWKALDSDDNYVAKAEFMTEDRIFVVNAKDGIISTFVLELVTLSTGGLAVENLALRLTDMEIDEVSRVLARDTGLYIEYRVDGGETFKTCFKVRFNYVTSRVVLIESLDCADLSALIYKQHAVWLNDFFTFSDDYASVLLIPSNPNVVEQPLTILRVSLVTGQIQTTKTLAGIKNFDIKTGIPSFYAFVDRQQRAEKSKRLMASNSASNPASTSFVIFSTEDSSYKVNWLAEIRLQSDQGVTNAQRSYSHQKDITVVVERQCNRMSCSGCVSRETQIACYVMQQCIVGKCVGTLINQRRPLCAIGLTAKSALDITIEYYRGMYMIMAQATGTVLQITLGDVKTFDITWPDEAFFGILCVSKDAIAHLTSVFSVTVNFLVQSVLGTPLQNIIEGAFSISTDLKAVATFASQSINQLLFQIALAPLYAAIFVQKLVVCQTSSLLAVSDSLGVKVTFGSEQLRQTASVVVGQCVPDGIETSSATLEETGEKERLAKAAAEISTDFFATFALGSATSAIDILIAYMKGIVTGFEDVAQSFSMAKCKLPDFYMNDVFDCACGDRPMRISPERRKETVKESAFWCTGTLEIPDRAGGKRIIYNPYSLQELEDLMLESSYRGASTVLYSALDRYLLCISRPGEYELEFGSRINCDTIKPRFDTLERQRVDTIAVMGRCRANYQLKEWDQGAYVFFTSDAPAKAKLEWSSANWDVGQCLLNVRNLGQGPDGCLMEFLSSFSDTRYQFLPTAGISKELYFSYEYADFESGSYESSAHTDACEVFSGPAELNAAMKNCLDATGGAGCQIAPFVWSARSNNKVPVAVTHKKTGGTSAQRFDVAEQYLSNARTFMEQAFEAFEAWKDQNKTIDAVLFSADGDFIHQTFDCAFMGALGNVDLWPLKEKGIPVPSWWRNSDGSLLFKKCTVDKLGDDVGLPFTCGSEQRRAVIKHFVRDYFPSFLTGNGEGKGTLNNTLIVQTVIKHVEQLKRDYQYTSNERPPKLEGLYACPCAGSDSNSFECCVQSLDGQFLPDSLQDSKFDTIASKQIAESLAQAISRFWAEELRSQNVDPWWKYLNEKAREELKWDLNDRGVGTIAAAAGMFSTVEPVLFHNASETTGPFNHGKESLWHTCTGLLGQQISSLPLKQNATGWFLESIDDLSYDFAQGDLRVLASKTLSALDDFSPVAALRDWRHVPSYSSVCKQKNPQKISINPVKRISLHDRRFVPHGLNTSGALKANLWGASSFTLNDEEGCFCGWYSQNADANCELPTDLLKPSEVPDFMQNSLAFNSTDNVKVMRALYASNVDFAEHCHYLHFSDHWGILTPTEAKKWYASLSSDNVSMNATEVIAFGRGGLRVEAWERLTSKRDFVISEKDRVKKLLAEDGFDLTTQAFCFDETDPQPASSDRGLFPVVQIVQESMPIAACSRYVIEAAKLFLVRNVTGVPSTLAEVAQQIISSKWEAKCNTQLHLLSTCHHMRVFEFVPASPTSQECPFLIDGSSRHYVTQPGCIVYIERLDAFFNPCLCTDCSSKNTRFDVDSDTHSQCKLWYDPRKLSRGWGSSVPEDFVNRLMDRIMVDQNEGLDFTTEEYCDSFVDWWPEAWEHPVGYHVTTPCTAEEAGYRTFDSSFAVRRTESNVTVEYEGVALRDPDLSAGFFGTNGLCRRTTYGFPLFEVNDLRLCTREHESYFDPFVSNFSRPERSTEKDFYCSKDGGDVPWQKDWFLPAHYRSFGTVPSLLTEGTLSYRGVDSLPTAGIRKDSGTTFYTQPQCTTNNDCGPGYSCIRNVCFDNDIECVKHEMCDNGKLCNADGKCVSSKLYIQSVLEEETEVELFSRKCADDNVFDNRGKTRWGAINNLFQAHGFCGYHEWHDYLLMCPDSSSCQLATMQSWKNSTKYTQDTILQERLMHLLAHPCDRDFQRSEKRKACFPSGQKSTSTRFYETVRNGQVEMLPPPNRSSDVNTLDFLGIPSNQWSRVAKCSDIPQCYNVPFTWNNQEKQNKYTFADTYECGGGMKVKDGDETQCVFDLDVVPFAKALCADAPSAGFKNADVQKCNENVQIIDTEKLELACSLLKKSWNKITIRQQGSAKIINSMFGVFNTFQETKTFYNASVNCILNLRSKQPTYEGNQSRNLYYAFEHSLYAFPFSWWFKCTYLKRNFLKVFNQGRIDCDEWGNTADSKWWLEDRIYLETPKTQQTTTTIPPEKYCKDLLKADIQQKSDIQIGSLVRAGLGGFNTPDKKITHMQCLESSIITQPDKKTLDCLYLQGQTNSTKDEIMDCFFYDQFNKLLYPDSSCSLAVKKDCMNTNIDQTTARADYSATKNILEQRFETLISTGILDDQLSSTSRQVKQCLLSQPLYSSQWAEENALPYNTCPIDATLENNDEIEFMTDDDILNYILKTKKFYQSFSQPFVESEYLQRYGPLAGIAPQKVFQIATTPNFEFEFGDIMCEITQTKIQQPGDVYQLSNLDFYSESVGTFDGIYWNRPTAFLQFGLDNEILHCMPDHLVVEKKVSPQLSYITTLIPTTLCTFLKKATERAQTIPRDKYPKLYRYSCQSDLTNSWSNPGFEIVSTNERQEDGEFSEFWLLIPKATCKDNFENVDRPLKLKDIILSLWEQKNDAHLKSAWVRESVASDGQWFVKYSFDRCETNLPNFPDEYKKCLYKSSFYRSNIKNMQGTTVESENWAMTFEDWNREEASINLKSMLERTSMGTSHVCHEDPSTCECFASADEFYPAGNENWERPVNPNRALFSWKIPKIKHTRTMCNGLSNCKYCYSKFVLGPAAQIENKCNYEDIINDAFYQQYLFYDTVEDNAIVFPRMAAEFNKQTLQNNNVILSSFEESSVATETMYAEIDSEKEFAFDTTENQLHEYFLAKDFTGTVKCLEQTDTTKINYLACNYNERLQRIQSHVEQQYTNQSAHIQRIRKSQDVAFADFDVLDGAILSFRNAVPIKSWTDIVFAQNESSLCRRGLESALNSYCYVQGTDEVVNLNPWTGGDYNPLEGCDTYREDAVRELVDGNCDTMVCTTDLERSNFIAGQPAGGTCQSRNTQPVQTNNIARQAENNICYWATRALAKECTQDFGLLGGGRGQPAADVYADSEFECSNSTASFFTKDGVNPLFYGESIEDACLQFSKHEMGPHTVNVTFSADNRGRRFSITSVQISNDTSASKTAEWYYVFQKECQQDTQKYNALYGGENWTFSTPYERISFWQGMHERGRPVTPDPQRSFAFHNTAVCGGVNPLQGMQDPFAEVAGNTQYKTVDGLCFCRPDATACTACAARFEDYILEYLRAMQGSETDTEFGADSATEHEPEYSTFFDWPLRKGVHRDGGTSQNSAIPQLDSRVVSRLPVFKARGTREGGRSKQQRQSDQTTLAQGGVCHMGRAVNTNRDSDIRDCWLLKKNASHAVFECNVGGQLRRKTMPLEKSKTPLDALEAMRGRRIRCSQCSTPKFQAQGKIKTAESSFGVPYRFAPVRRILRELRELADSYDAQHAQRWGSADSPEDRARFADTTLREAATSQLFSSESPFEKRESENREKFDNNWLFCDGQVCKGRIAYDEWLNMGPAERIDECKEQLLNNTNNGEDLIVNMEICDIDRTLDEFCTKLRAAKQTVFNANCHAAGLCEEDTFVYSPSVYSVSNNDFVRATVRNFYLRHGDNLCPSADSDTEDLIAQNELEMAQCPSTYLHVFNEALSQLREAAHMIARAMLYIANVATSLFRLVVSTDGGWQAINDLKYWFEKLVTELKKIIEELAQLVFTLIFESSGAGKVMKHALQEVCRVVAFIFDKLRWLWCEISLPVVQFIVDLIEAVVYETEKIINDIPFVSGFEFTLLRNILSEVKKLITSLKDWVCDPENVIPCDFAPEEGDDTNRGALPVATRCWADFVPFAALSSSLSCSRADTCIKENLGSELVVCDACASQEDELFNDFGCNLLTKRCTCKTQPRLITYCTENSQCSGETTCLLVDDPFADLGWGVDFCASCSTQATCVIQSSDSVGKCVCPFTYNEPLTCSENDVSTTGVPNSVYIDPLDNSLCYFTFSQDLIDVSVTSVSRGGLAVTKCILLNPVRKICIEVEGVPSVVGYQLDAAGRRRLLSTPLLQFIVSDQKEAQETLQEQLLVTANWNNTADPCKSLVHAYRKSEYLGPVDSYVLKQCVFWRMVGNMTGGIPDTLFVSFEDAVKEVIQNPTVVLQALVSAKNATHAIIALWPAAQEFVKNTYKLFRAHNETWLSIANEFFEPYTHQHSHPKPNLEAYLNMSSQHRRQLLTTHEVDDFSSPRIENFTTQAIIREYLSIESRERQRLEQNGIDPERVSSLKSAIQSQARFQASGFDDFLKQQQADPTFRYKVYWTDADNDGEIDADTCPVLFTILENFKDKLGLLKKYYSEGPKRLAGLGLVPLAETLPRLKSFDVTGIPDIQPERVTKNFFDNFTRSLFLFWNQFVMARLGITKQSVRAFFMCSTETEYFSLCNFVRDIFRCDDEAVQLCHKRRMNPYLGFGICIVMFLAVSLLLSTNTLTASLSSLLWMMLIPFTFAYVYGYSINCFPAVPTCLAEDLLLPIYYFIPRNFKVSSALQTSPSCWRNLSIPAHDCFKSCSSTPEFNYRAVSALYAQLVCEIYGVECNDAARFGPPAWLHWLIDPADLARDLKFKQEAQMMYLARFPPEEDKIVAQRFCMMLGFVYVAPYVIFAVTLVIALCILPTLLFSVISAAVQLLLQVVYYTHMSLDNNI